MLTALQTVRRIDQAGELADVEQTRKDLTRGLMAMRAFSLRRLADAVGVRLSYRHRTKTQIVERLVRWATERSHAKELIAY